MSKGQQSIFPLRQEKEVSRGQTYASTSEISKNGFSFQNCSYGAASPPVNNVADCFYAQSHYDCTEQAA